MCGCIVRHMASMELTHESFGCVFTTLLMGPVEVTRMMDLVKDGAVVLWDFFVAGHEHVASGTAAGFGLRKVGSIAVDCERHIAGFVGENGVVLHCHVVKELLAECHGAFRRIGLLGGERAECGEKPAVDTASKEKEHAANLLDKFFPYLVEEGGIIVRPGKLRFGAVVGLDMWVWLVLRLARGGMLKACEGFGHVLWHGEVNLLALVVPF